MIAVAFAGCACRAAFHAGVAAAFADGKLPVAATAGASSGSLVAAGLAAGRGAELPDVWRGLGGRSVVSWRRLHLNRSPFDMSHLVRTTLRRVLGQGDLRAAPVEALVTATRLPDLACRVFSSREEPDMVEPLLASCFFPVLYGRAVRIGGHFYLDGGATDNLPVEALAARGARHIVAVVASPDGRTNKTPFRRRWRPAVPGVRVDVVHPPAPLEIGPWDLDAGRIDRALETGWEAGRRYLTSL